MLFTLCASRTAITSPSLLFRSVLKRYSSLSSKRPDMEQYIPFAKRLLNFVDQSVSPYHAVENSRKLLEGAGFQYLSENHPWNVQPGGKYFFTRNQSTIVAFAVGKKFQPGNGFNIVGAHTDSPNLKVKPHSAVEASGYFEVGVELYGGGIWHSWFDRDLTVAGRVLVKDGDKFVSRLVKINKPLLRIPTLAIHLDRSVNTDGFKFNTQTHLLPVLSSAVKKELQGNPKPDHHPLLLDLLAKELGVDASDIQTFDLNLCDVQPGAIGGALDEFIFSPRLDNLCMSFCSLQGLIDAVSSPSFQEETNVHLVMLFDNEEVGSSSQQGAASPLVLDVINRVTALHENLPQNTVDQAIRRSFLISADMAHAIHPNYASNHEPLHQPKINAGPVIKHNANLRYTTTAFSAFVIKELAKRGDVPIQEFVVKNDSACGSTIGPILSTLAGIRAVDIGNPQWSMHSIREQCGVADPTYATKLLREFFEHFSTLDKKIVIDQ